MSYNKIPNILVDSVTVTNKPLSNLEIMMLIKGSQWVDLEEYFARNSFYKNKFKRMRILNLDSSSGDGTYWVMWFKNKDKFYFDSYGVQPPSMLIAYLKSPLFYRSERVQQNGEVFFGNLCLFALKQLSLGNNLQAVINYLI